MDSEMQAVTRSERMVVTGDLNGQRDTCCNKKQESGCYRNLNGQ